MIILGNTAASPCSADQWVFRPGLWRAITTTDGLIVHIPPKASADMRAKLRAMALPKIFSHQARVRLGSKPGALFFDPEVQPPGICSEKRVYNGEDVELLENNCVTPHLLIAGLDVPSIAAKTTRYVSLNGTPKGMVWGIDSVVQHPKVRTNVRHTLRWIGSQC